MENVTDLATHAQVVENALLAPTHGIYLLISLAATIWVARTLQKHGRLFLVDAFGSAELAEAVNHLLVVGFYLINIGYVCLKVEDYRVPHTIAEVITIVGTRIGKILMVLGGMHFLNLFVFNRLRRRSEVRRAVAPVMPSEVIAAPRMA